MTTARRPRARAAEESWTSSTLVMRGWRTSSNSCSGNWLSTASASFAAVSPWNRRRRGSRAARSSRNLREVAQSADRVANVEQQAQSVRPHGAVVGHHEHLVEEAVDDRPEPQRPRAPARTRARCTAASILGDADSSAAMSASSASSVAASDRAKARRRRPVRQPVGAVVRDVGALELIGRRARRQRLRELRDGAEPDAAP